MLTPSPSTPRSTLPGAAARSGRQVVDAPIRMFHWLFALSFLGAYLSADGERWRMLHVALGYNMAGLLMFRVLYGLWGPRQAGLGLMRRKLETAPNWFRSVWQGRFVAGVNWNQGANVGMALTVVSMLLLVLPLTLSGYGTFNDWGDVLGGDWVEEIHEFFGVAMLWMVVLHLALLGALSLWRRKNTAMPMLTGKIDGPGPDLVRSNRAWLAIVLLLCVVAFMAWEWHTAPKGLVPAQGWSRSAHDRHDHDD